MLEGLRARRDERKARRAAGIKPLPLTPEFWESLWEATSYTAIAVWDREIDGVEFEGIWSRWLKVKQIRDAIQHPAPATPPK